MGIHHDYVQIDYIYNLYSTRVKINSYIINKNKTMYVKNALDMHKSTK